MTNYPLVSIIIVNWNGGEVFKACLKSISSLSYPNWELIVVDNGSTDGSQKIDLPHRLIQNDSNVGFAVANNQAVSISKGEFLLLLNNDTLVNNDLLKVLVNYLIKNPDVGIVQPKIKIMDNPTRLDNSGSFFTLTGFLIHNGFNDLDSSKYDKIQKVFSAKGACILVSKELVKRIGLFDPDFVSYFEETDFCWRAWAAGFDVIYYPKTFIYHKVGFSSKRLNAITVNYHSFKNRIITIIKDANISTMLIVLPVHLACLLFLIFIYCIKLQFSNAKMIIYGIMYNMAHLRQTLDKRSKVQNLRKLPDRQFLSSVTKNLSIKTFLAYFSRIESDISNYK